MCDQTTLIRLLFTFLGSSLLAFFLGLLLLLFFLPSLPLCFLFWRFAFMLLSLLVFLAVCSRCYCFVVGHRDVAVGCDRWSGKDVGGGCLFDGRGFRGCGISWWSREVGIVLCPGLWCGFVGTAVFLDLVNMLCHTSQRSGLTSSLPSDFIFFFSRATGPMPQRRG